MRNSDLERFEAVLSVAVMRKGGSYILPFFYKSCLGFLKVILSLELEEFFHMVKVSLFPLHFLYIVVSLSHMEVGMMEG